MTRLAPAARSLVARPPARSVTCASLAAAAGLALAVAACSDPPSNAAGAYAVTVINRDNGCMFGNWTPGTAATADVTLTQDTHDVTAEVTGLGAVVLELAVGGHTYAGMIQGGDLDLNLFGTRTNTLGNCTYTLNSEIHAVISGDVMTGQINYTSAPNGNPDCAPITGCLSFQDFSGNRPAP
jgi:hypothetical protein